MQLQSCRGSVAPGVDDANVTSGANIGVGLVIAMASKCGSPCARCPGT